MQFFGEVGGRAVVEDDSVSVVEFVLDREQVVRAVKGEVGSLLEVLAEQAVGVLVRAALPGSACLASRSGRTLK